jgi:hypothetical protein
VPVQSIGIQLLKMLSQHCYRAQTATMECYGRSAIQCDRSLALLLLQEQCLSAYIYFCKGQSVAEEERRKRATYAEYENSGL